VLKFGGGVLIISNCSTGRGSILFFPHFPGMKH